MVSTMGVPSVPSCFSLMPLSSQRIGFVWALWARKTFASAFDMQQLRIPALESGTVASNAIWFSSNQSMRPSILGQMRSLPSVHPPSH